MNIRINARKILNTSLIIVSFLLAAQIIVQVAIFKFNHDQTDELILFFTFDGERNLPSYYSSLLLIFSAILLNLIGQSNKQNHLAYSYWYALSTIFLYLAIDEATSIHEHLAAPLRRLTRSTGTLELSWLSWISSNGYILRTFLNYIWMIPYGIVILILALIFPSLSKELPRKTVFLLLFAGVVYLLGAMGFELISGFEVEVHGLGTVLYTILATIEESLEMLGVVIFNYALLEYIAEHVKDVNINLK